MSSRDSSVLSALALFVRWKMTLEVVMPGRLTRVATRGVKQPNVYGSRAALDSAVSRANAGSVQEHSGDVTAEPPEDWHIAARGCRAAKPARCQLRARRDATP